MHVIDPAAPLYDADPETRLGIRPAMGWAALWTAVEAIKPSLIIVDPLSAALEGVSVNEGSAGQLFSGRSKSFSGSPAAPESLWIWFISS